VRIGRVMGTVTLGTRLPELAPGRLLLVEVLDRAALEGHAKNARRKTPMPESLVVYDEMGAGAGQLIGISEGAEATMPLRPKRVPLDAYCSAILDVVEMTVTQEKVAI